MVFQPRQWAAQRLPSAAATKPLPRGGLIFGRRESQWGNQSSCGNLAVSRRRWATCPNESGRLRSAARAQITRDHGCGSSSSSKESSFSKAKEIGVRQHFMTASAIAAAVSTLEPADVKKHDLPPLLH